ncbi:hypothetical protein SAMN05660662_0317 [Blastococcus aurantiacus]|uniref:4-amino-4-deoxy-L-arabinose transferase n=1 Tax=Blastococcus aurantiacus TaxID=1550231 RepID=A0A1G7RFX5_9ACTN|nr:hypothetical protein [Blastococcus aurantiacus]SDG09663.1 hypothetical protein SAMN05660662_0317 [Blastococcus aurantiacus]
MPQPTSELAAATTPIPVTSDPASEPVADDRHGDDGDGQGRGRKERRVRRLAGAGLLLLAALPALFGLVALLRDRDAPSPIGDYAVFALVVDAIGRHEVLLGPFSRFGWFHPGPMAAYLMAAPYRLLDGAPEALLVGAIVIGGISCVAAVGLVLRRAGLLAATSAVLVLCLTLRVLGVDFLTEAWNPYLPVLPLLAGVLLCWTAIRGDAWGLPLAVIPMSLALQSHVGFLAPVGGVGAVLALGLVVRAVRHRRGRSGRSATAPDGRPVGRPVRWIVATLAAVALAVLLWLPPIIQQLTRDPGNMTEILEYLRQGSTERSMSFTDALRAIGDEFGRLPAYVVGADVPAREYLPLLVPPAAIAVGLGSFLVALAVGARRRNEDVLWLGGLTVAVAAAGVAAIARLDGPPYSYITRWTVLVGILAWTTVALSLLPEVVAGLRRALGGSQRAARPVAVLATALAAVTTAVVLVTAVDTARAKLPGPDVTVLAQAVVGDLERLGLRTPADAPVVRVDFTTTTRDELMGTYMPGTGVVLQLAREDVDVQVSPFWVLPFGERYTDRAEDAGYIVTVAYSDGTSPPPEPWQRVLGVAGEFQVYGGIPPTG